jgi:hypothetical protein
MKCPYCAEIVKEEAKVRRYCHQEIGLLIAEQAKVRGRQNEISDLERRVEEAERLSQPIIMRWTANRKRTWLIALVVFIAVVVPPLATGVTIILDNTVGPGIDPATFAELGYGLVWATLTFLAWFLPLPLGFVVALLWPHPHQWAYVGLGLLVGMLQTLLAILVFEVLARWVSQPDWDRFAWNLRDLNVTVFIVSWFVLTALLFMSGGFLGEVAKLKANAPEKWMHGLA